LLDRFHGTTNNGNNYEACVVLVASTLLVAFTSQMTALAAAVACLGCIWTVLGDVTSAIALITRDVTRSTIIHRFGAIARPVPKFVALVTSWIVSLCALLGNVAYAIAAITAFRFLGTSARKMPKLVTLIAFFAITASSATAATTTAAAATTTSTAITHRAGVTIASEVARSVTLIARGSRHFFVCFVECRGCLTN